MSSGHIYFVGIKGVGMAALARLCQDRGYSVSGADIDEAFITDDSLTSAHIPVDSGFSGDLPKDIDLLIYTAAHQGNQNSLVNQAKQKRVTVLNYGQAIQYFLNDKKIIAVSGTHGKTTTTAMLATIFYDAGLNPSWLIGTGTISTLPANGHFGEGEYAIVEADEYFDEPGGKPKFLYLNPHGLIISSLEWDHPDVFSTPKNFVNAFHKLLKRVNPKGILVLKGDDKNLRRLTKSSPQKIRWILPGQTWHGLHLSVPGAFNRTNATFAATMAHELGVSQDSILSSLKNFKGVQRRLEFKREYNGWKIFDDYAHHPTEIKAAISAIKEAYPDAYVTIAYQPHTYSRTKALLSGFLNSFTLADQVLIAPTFSSAREKNHKESIELSDVLTKADPKVKLIASSKELMDYLQHDNHSGNKILITMGAGTIYQWIEE